MFADFFDHIDKELGPLNPYWFEELTAKVRGDDGGLDRSKDEEEEENAVKAPEISALASQLFSTPKIFKQHFQSPDSVPNEESPYQVTNGLDSSPCLFGSGKEKFDRCCGQPSDCFGLLDTPKRSLAHSANQISRSLGAQINPDLSWTSSFNTPSSLTPTVILPKTGERSSMISCLKDKESIFVRKLFPSLSKGPESAAAFSKTPVKRDDTVKTDGLGVKPLFSPEASLDTSNLWKQTVPSAIEDGDVRSTVQSVLDGAEDALSIFFSNRTSAPGRVKSKERNIKDVNLTLETDKEGGLLKGDDEIQTPEVKLKSPLKNNDVMQWTPLSLSDSSLTESLNTVVSSKVNAAGGSQSFLSTVEKLCMCPDAHADTSQVQKPLLEKSPAFSLNRKPRRFVYKVPSFDASKTGINHKAPVCLEQTVTENPSKEKMSSDLDEFRVDSENTTNAQTLQQHDLDEGLDMTQLSKAFAEDFTQELTSGECVVMPVQNDQNEVVFSTVTTHFQTTSQDQPDAESEQNQHADRDDNSTLADVSVNSAVVLTTFEVSRDSGCPTTFSDVDGTTASKDIFAGFKTASNRIISIPNEAIIRARASLHEAIGDSLMNTLDDVTPQHNHNTETLSKPVSKSDVQSSPGLLSSKSFKQNISSCSSPQPESDYTTCSKRNITDSDVVLQKAGSLLKENSDSSKRIHQKLQFRSVAERQTVLHNNSKHKPGLETSRDDADKNGPLTASQKADVTELCNLLEEADSQYEFTQFKPIGSDIHTTEKEWDADILNNIDFNDSFNCDVVNRSQQAKTDASTINSSVYTNKEHECAPSLDVGSISKVIQNEMVPYSKIEDNVVDGTKIYFGAKNQSHCFGFKTAKGRAISISEMSLDKAKHFFQECDEKVLCERKDNNTEQAKVSSVNTSDRMDKEHVSHLQSNQDANAAHKDLEINKKAMGDAGTELNCLDEKTDVVCFNSNIHFGFSTAGGKQLKVSQTALVQARKLLNDVDSFEASEPQELIFHTSGRHDDSMSTTALKTTKAVSWQETSVNINQSDTEKINQVSNVMDIPSSKCKNFFQEQKSGSDAERIFTNICPPKTCQPSSVYGYGFQTASGKEVSVSAEALIKANTIFKECDDDLEAAILCEKNDKLNVEILKQTNGFTTTSCKFSKVVLEEAKAVYKDSDLINGFSDRANERNDFFMKTCKGNRVQKPSLDQQPPQEEECKQTVKELNKDLHDIFCKDPFESVSLDSNCGFSTASGKKVSVSAEALQRAKDVLCDSVDVFPCASSVDIQTDTSSSGNHGFFTAGGKKLAISHTVLQRAKNLFKDCEEESLDRQHQSCEGVVSEKEPKMISSESGSISRELKGFSNAGGKKVPVSATALQRAKSLLQDCENEGLTSEAFQNQSCKGFSTASGKHVTVSKNALYEVKGVFTGFVETSCQPSVPSGERGGFCTAGGKKVTISATALQRAKNLFQDCEEENVTSEELETVRSHARSKDNGDDNPKFDDKSYGFSTASGKVVSISKVAIEEATKLFRDCDAQQVTDTKVQHVAGLKPHHVAAVSLDGFNDEESEPISHPLPAKVVFNEPAHLDLHSLDLNSCTETQQEYFEQEAMACTKALLADDDLNEPPGLVESVSTQCKKSQSESRKRPLDESSIADSCQPPLKRQLISEFDQTVNCAKTSKPTPLRSFPNGTLKARRVFKYNVQLQTKVTCPTLNSVAQKTNDYVQNGSTASIQTRSQKKPVFVPPFKKNKAETSNSQDASKVSGGFIPPFKKDNQDNTCPSNSLINNTSINTPCESKPEVDACTALENTMTNSTPSPEQYCGENNVHVTSKSEETISVENLSFKTLDCEKRETEAWQEILQLARDLQDIRLRKKKRQTVRPLPGRIYLAKTSGVSRISLRDAVGHKCPVQHTPEELHHHGVRYKVPQITSENAESFRFDCKDFFKREVLVESGAVQLADGGWLVPDSNGAVGKEEFCRALYDTPGVDPKLINDAWVFNHYRWIVWKRASMERAFPDLMGSLCLTPEQVLLQLKFRYDVEVDNSRRSSLRRIVERDDTPAKTLVLCVCGIAKLSRNPEKIVKTEDRSPESRIESTVIWLTDCWYAIKGLLDLPLSAMLNKGRLRIGDKIVINGAELVGSQEACPPLEAPESLMLKISANSTRRARWDTKLGYYRDPRPFRLPLSSLCAAGGVVSCVDIVVLRSYPTQWMEKKPNGVFVFRNDRAEDREARKHSSSKHKTMELLISNIQAQFEKEMEGKKKSQARRRTFNQHDIEALQDGEDLYEAIESDPAIETHLSERQMEAVSKFRCCVGEMRQVELQERVQKAVKEAREADGGCPDREVTPVWKLSVVDANDLQSFVYTLNIWRPSSDLYSLLKEGRRYRVCHLATSESKKRSGVAHIQLTATKKTLFQDIEVIPEWLRLHFHARECVCFKELQNPQFISPCGEVDIVGYIVSIVDKQGNSPILHLTDEKFDLISVRTSGSLEQLAIEEIVKPQTLVALSNLQLRQLSGPVPCLYAGEQALFSINPKESHLQEAMVHLKSFVQTCEEFFSIAEEKMSNMFPSGVSGSFQSPRTPGVSNPKINGGVTPQQKVYTPFTPLTKRTPESTSNCEAKDPKSVKRKRGLVYLSRIPSPPPLTPLKTKASPCVNKTFNPPRRSVTPKPPEKKRDPPRASRPLSGEEEWVHDEELAMIDTQALMDGLKED